MLRPVEGHSPQGIEGVSYGMLPKCQGLDLRLRSALFLAFELSFSRLPFLAGHCFSRSIVVRPADRRRRSQELGPKPLFFGAGLGWTGHFCRSRGLFALVGVLTLTWSMAGCRNSFITASFSVDYNSRN